MLLVFFGEAGSDIIYFITILGVMLLHIFVVLVLLLNDTNKIEFKYNKWSYVDLLITVIMFIIFYLNYELILNFLFKLNQTFKLKN